jgi:hypothetical protein
VADSTDRKTKLAALRERIVPVAKSDDLLAVARELEALGQDLAREERPQRPTSGHAWPRDMNESAERTAANWGKDPGEDVHG